MHEPTGPRLTTDRIECATCGALVAVRSSSDGDSAWLEHTETPYAPWRVRGCPTCDTDPGGLAMMPPHKASDRCESKGYNHCSCDICF